MIKKNIIILYIHNEQNEIEEKIIEMAKNGQKMVRCTFSCRHVELSTYTNKNICTLFNYIVEITTATIAKNKKKSQHKRLTSH